MPDAGEWDGPRGYDHTFRSGRTARLRVALPTFTLQRSGEWDDELSAAFDLAVAGELEDNTLALRLNDAFVIGMFIRPRVIRSVPEGEAVPAGCILIGDLDNDEIEETSYAAFGGPAILALFRDDAADADDPVDGGDVAGAAVGSAGVGAGERGGARGRRSSGKPAA